MEKMYKTDVYKEDLLSLYKEGNSLSKISKQYNFCVSTLAAAFIRWNINLRPSRTYFPKEDYFNKIDSEEKAYWLGFLFADGCVVKNRLQLALSIKDEAHLKKFRDSLSPEQPLYQYISTSNKPIVSFFIYSKILVKDLENLGLTERKTFTTEFPKLDKYIPSFIRGYFDGDGCVGIDKSTSNLRFSINGTESFLLEIQKHLVNNLGLNTTKLQKERKGQGLIFKLQYGGNKQVPKIYQYLYEDTKVHLERKKLKFEQIIVP